MAGDCKDASLRLDPVVSPIRRWLQPMRVAFKKSGVAAGSYQIARARHGKPGLKTYQKYWYREKIRNHVTDMSRYVQ